MKNKLVMIGYRPGRKSKMVKRLIINKGCEITTFGTVRNFLEIYKNQNPTIADFLKGG